MHFYNMQLSYLVQIKPSSQYDIKPHVHHIVRQNRNTFYLDALDVCMYYWTQRMALHHIVNQALASCSQTHPLLHEKLWL